MKISKDLRKRKRLGNGEVEKKKEGRDTAEV